VELLHAFHRIVADGAFLQRYRDGNDPIAQGPKVRMTRRWRRQSRANPSLNIFPASWENTGNFARFGVHWPKTGLRKGCNPVSFWANSLRSEQGKFFSLTEKQIGRSGSPLNSSGKADTAPLKSVAQPRLGTQPALRSNFRTQNTFTI